MLVGVAAVLLPAINGVLPDKRDDDGVIDIVIGYSAGRNIFKTQLSDKTDCAGIL